MIEMDCPHCKMLLRIPEQYKGESGKCNHCGSPITAQILSSSSDQKLKSENAVDRSQAVIYLWIKTYRKNPKAKSVRMRSG
jgi:DNA-directed RNA polymerase subunit M/transcription elongation factor TFIIS